MDYLEQGGTPFPIVVIFLMAVALLSFFLVPIIHETGHLVMGLLTGYEFVSFRIGSFTLVKENGKLKRKKFNIAGTGGQCILTYKSVNEPEKIPYFWYNFGGVFFNFLTVLICIPIIVITKNSFIMVGFAMLAIISLGLGIINFIPTKAMGMGNDGYNLLLLKKSPIDRSAMYKTMLLNALQCQGIRLEDMQSDIIKVTDEEKKCTFGIGLTIIEANLLMNRHDFDGAEKIYRSIAEDKSSLGIYQNECKCEMMFCMIMNGYTSEEINAVYDVNLKKYIDVTGKTYIMRKRLMYAYYLIVEKNATKAAKEYHLAKKMENTYPIKGEYLSEMDLIEYIKSNFS